MADTEKRIYIDVEARTTNAEEQLQELYTTQRKLQDSISELNKQWKDGAIDEKEYGEQAAQLKKQLSETNTEIRRYSKEQTNANKARKDDINGLRAQLQLLTADYDALGEEERKAAAGQDLQRHIQEITDELNTLEGDTGRFGRRVGDYRGALREFAESFLKAGANAKTFGGAITAMGGVVKKTFNSLMKNPWLAVITAALGVVVGLFQKFKKAIQSSDEAGTALQRVMAQLKVPLEVLQKIINAIVVGLVGFINGVADVAKAVMSVIPAFKEQAERMDELVIEQDKLEEHERQYAENHAKREAEISELREKASDAERYTVNERIGFIRQAQQKEKEDLKERKAIADEKIKIFKLETANQKDLSDEQKKQLNDLTNEKRAADKAYYDSSRNLNKALKGLGNEQAKEWNNIKIGINKATEAINEYYDGLLKTQAETARNNVTDRLKELSTTAGELTAKAQAMGKDGGRIAKGFEDIAKKAKNAFNAGNISEFNKQVARLYLVADKAQNVKGFETIYNDLIGVADAISDEAENYARGMERINKERAEAIKTAKDVRAKAAAEADKEAKARQTALSKAQADETTAYINGIKDKYLQAELLTKTNFEKEKKDIEAAIKEQEAIKKKFGGNTDEYRTAVKQAEALNNTLTTKTKNYYTTIEELAKKHEEEIRQAQRGTEELRVAAMREGIEKERAAYQLKIEAFNESERQLLNDYNEALAEVRRLNDEDVITAETAERRKTELTRQYEAERTAITIQKEAERNGLLKKEYAHNVETINKALTAINNAYTDALRDSNAKDVKIKQEALEEKAAALKELYDQLNALTEEEALKEYGTLEAYKEELKSVGEAATTAANEVKSSMEAIEADNLKTLETAAANTKQLTDAISAYYSQRYDEILKDKEKLTDEEKKQALNAAETEYAATMAGLVLNQASGMGNVVVGASKALAETPYPYNLIAFASTLASGLASVISGITQAKAATQTFQERKAQISKMAVGGYVEGAGTATSDSIPARLSNGESVINARSTAMFYDELSRINQIGGGVAFPNTQPMTERYRFANGGVAVNYSVLGEIMREAVAEVTPVVSVKEITHVANRVRVKEESI